MAVLAKLAICAAVLGITGCATGGWVEVPVYVHYYFYEPHVAVSASHFIIRQDAATIDLTAREGTLSITTISRGDQGFIMGRRGDIADYTGLLALDAATHDDGAIPMTLWVAASCPSGGWVLRPNRVRLVDRTRNSSEVELAAYLQPIPALLHPDTKVLIGHGQYSDLNGDQEIRCENGDTIAFTAHFDTTLRRSALRIVFANALRDNRDVIPVPDVDLSLSADKIYKATKRVNALEALIRSLPHQ